MLEGSLPEKNRYEKYGRALVDTLLSLPKSDKLHTMIVDSSVFRALLRDDPIDREWCSSYEDISLYETRYGLLANLVLSVLKKRRSGGHIEQLAQDVLQAEKDFSEEKHRQALFLQLKQRLPELNDGEVEQKVQDFLKRQDALMESFLRKATESPEETQPIIQNMLSELHESMRQDRSS